MVEFEAKSEDISFVHSGGSLDLLRGSAPPDSLSDWYDNYRITEGGTALAAVIPLLVFGLPIIDTLLSMTRRIVGSLWLLRSSRVRLKE